MIRDPSDGTVREKPSAAQIPAAKPVVKDPLTTPVTGLRQPTRTDAQLRLEKSRSWLKEFHAKKEREYARADAAAERSFRPDHTGENQ